MLRPSGYCWPGSLSPNDQQRSISSSPPTGPRQAPARKHYPRLLLPRRLGCVASRLRSRAHCCFASGEAKTRSRRLGSPAGDKGALSVESRARVLRG
jgi:hypothetical protein